MDILRFYSNEVSNKKIDISLRYFQNEILFVYGVES